MCFSVTRRYFVGVSGRVLSFFAFVGSETKKQFLFLCVDLVFCVVVCIHVIIYIIVCSFGVSVIIQNGKIKAS